MMLGNESRYIEYGSFSMEDETGLYKLHVSEFTGTAGDATYDRDSDVYRGNCAQQYHGAWWYDGCHSSNLNGDYGNTTFGPLVIL
ncbi:TENR-like protein [Mya arenaria]|uniref:TENR-like protein n=1 Tax=Mya arenaria TaxID=6604 RepID=A0ABY7DEA3_MYAAR|nr:TENR-like protein [Mya arenaria]